MPVFVIGVESIDTTASSWTAARGETPLSALQSDDGLTASGSSYTNCSTNSSRLIGVNMDNPSVASGSVDTITSVQIIAKGRCPARGSGGSDVKFYYITPSGYDATLNFHNNSNYELETDTAQTQKPDATNWDYGDIEDFVCTIEKIGTAEVHLSYFALRVVYVEAAVTDNSIFFGANF